MTNRKKITFKGKLGAILKLIELGGEENISKAYELVKNLNEPYDELFDLWDFTDYKLIPKNWSLKDIFNGHVIDFLLMSQLSIAPENSKGAEIRKNVTKLNLLLSSPIEINRLDRLEKFEISLTRGFEAQDVNWLGSFPSLKNLKIDFSRSNQSTSLKSITGLESPNLNSLWLQTPGLEDITGLSNHQFLKDLQFITCDELKDISPLATLKSLENLTFHNCAVLADLTVISKLDSLKTLELSSLVLLKDLSPISHQQFLKKLTIKDCPTLGDLSPLTKLTSLRELTIENCSNVKNFKLMQGKKNLTIQIKNNQFKD
jgi:DNA-binding cell septation regulator SpoVG